MEWREKYNLVLKSERWQALRARLFTERGRKCERCKQPSTLLQLHHLTYERLGEELDSDLQVLCLQCHSKADTERAVAGARRSMDGLFMASIRRRYGDDYEPTERDWDNFQDYLRDRE